jgi:hypothetical protein
VKESEAENALIPPLQRHEVAEVHVRRLVRNGTDNTLHCRNTVESRVVKHGRGAAGDPASG